MKWVEYVRGKKVSELGAREDAAFRRISVPLDGAEVLATVAETLGVEQSAFLERRRNSVLRGGGGALSGALRGKDATGDRPAAWDGNGRGGERAGEAPAGPDVR